jgi:predicted regulator of Ras-like GTPase activity (Roadblock/LC7/MglB family)
MSRLEDLIAQFRSEIPHFVSTDIVQIESGLSVVGGSIDPNFDSSLASACYAEVVKSNSQALDLLGLSSRFYEDILITARDVYILLRNIGQEHYLCLAVTKQGALAYARSIMKKYEPLFLAAMKEFGGVLAPSS